MNAGPNHPDQRLHDSRADALRERPNLLVHQQLPSPPQQERSRRARDGLLAAALGLFAENGYDATTVDEIARRAGVAVGGFYLHFRSKQQVLLVLMEMLLAELETRFGPSGVTTPSPERLLTSVHFDSPYIGVYRAWREAALRDASIAALDAEIEAWTSAHIAAALSAFAMTPEARVTVDLHSFAWMLSVLWWRLLENLGLDRDALARAPAALVQAIRFEDDPLSAELHPLTAEETS